MIRKRLSRRHVLTPVLTLVVLQSWDREHSGLRQHIAPLREAVLIGAKRVPIETVVSCVGRKRCVLVERLCWDVLDQRGRRHSNPKLHFS